MGKKMSNIQVKYIDETTIIKEGLNIPEKKIKKRKMLVNTKGCLNDMGDYCSMSENVQLNPEHKELSILKLPQKRKLNQQYFMGKCTSIKKGSTTNCKLCSAVLKTNSTSLDEKRHEMTRHLKEKHPAEYQIFFTSTIRTPTKSNENYTSQTSASKTLSESLTPDTENSTGPDYIKSDYKSICQNFSFQEEVPDICICRSCYMLVPTKNGNTSDMIEHLKIKHNNTHLIIEKSKELDYSNEKNHCDKIPNTSTSSQECPNASSDFISNNLLSNKVIIQIFFQNNFLDITITTCKICFVHFKLPSDEDNFQSLLLHLMNKHPVMHTAFLRLQQKTELGDLFDRKTGKAVQLAIDLWDFFKDESKDSISTCKLCLLKMKRKFGSTVCMTNHLKKKHYQEFRFLTAGQNGIPITNLNSGENGEEVEHIWKFFTSHKEPLGEIISCNYCSSQIKQPCISTMIHHLKVEHPPLHQVLHLNENPSNQNEIYKNGESNNQFEVSEVKCKINGQTRPYKEKCKMIILPPLKKRSPKNISFTQKKKLARDEKNLHKNNFTQLERTCTSNGSFSNDDIIQSMRLEIEQLKTDHMLQITEERLQNELKLMEAKSCMLLEMKALVIEMKILFHHQVQKERDKSFSDVKTQMKAE